MTDEFLTRLGLLLFASGMAIAFHPRVGGVVLAIYGVLIAIGVLLAK